MINLIASDRFLGALGVETSSTPIAGVCDRYRRNQSWSQRPRAQNAGYGEQPLILSFLLGTTFSVQDESLEGRLTTSFQFIIFRARHSSKFMPISNCRERRHRLLSKKEKINNEVKTSKVTRCIHFRNI